MPRLRPIALLLAAALVAAGCGRSGAARPNATATLVLDGPPAAVHAGIYLALARDFDDAEGVTLRLRTPRSPADAARRLRTGEARFAVLDIHDLVRERERGRDLVAVMALVQRPLAAVLAAGPVRRPRDLAGRRAAIAGRRGDGAILDAIVRHDGGDPRRVRRVRAADPVAALVSGRVAAASGFWSDEALRRRADRSRSRVFRVDDYGAPPYPELVLCVGRETLTDERGVVRATIAALRRGYVEALADPESAIGALADRVPGVDRAAAQEAFDAVEPAFTEGVPRFGDFAPGRLRAWAVWAARVGITRAPPDVAQAFALGL